MVRDLHPEYRYGMRNIAKLPKGQIADMKYLGNHTIRIIFEDGRVVDIPLGQDN